MCGAIDLGYASLSRVYALGRSGMSACEKRRKNQIMTGLVLMHRLWAVMASLLMFGFLTCAAHAQGSRPVGPKIVSLSFCPENPVPNISVDVVCEVSHTWAMGNVSLAYSLDGRTNVTVMILARGNSTWGEYHGRIPPATEYANVTFHVVAEDILGTVTLSPTSWYVVLRDRIPPVIRSVDRPRGVGGYQVDSLIPGESPEIRVEITDSGSGVANATIEYAVYSLSEWNASRAWDLSSSTNMFLVSGDSYRGVWSCNLTAQEEGHVIFYRAIACDFYRNIVTSEVLCITVESVPRSYVRLDVEIREMDVEKGIAEVGVWLGATFASPLSPKTIPVQCRLTIGNTLAGFFFLDLTERGRFWYDSDGQWNASLYGHPQCYPYDCYELNLTFEIWGSFDEPRTDAYLGGRLGHYWTMSITNNATRKDDGKTYLTLSLRLDRRSDVANPIIYPLLVLFFVLGGSALLDLDEGGIRTRIGLYGALLIFVAGYSLSLATVVPRVLGLTIPQAMASSLVLGIAVYFTISLTYHFLIREIPRWGDNWMCDLVPDVVSASLSLLCVCFISQTRVLDYPVSVFERSPWLMMVIAMGLFIGVIVSVGVRKYSSLREH